MNKKKIFSNTYKQFKYFVFKLLYGKIDRILLAKRNKKITIKKISFKDLTSYNLYNIPKGRIYSDTTMDTAFILNKSLIISLDFILSLRRTSTLQNYNKRTFFSIQISKWI